jgi:AraC-like DNA-binding protein
MNAGRDLDAVLRGAAFALDLFERLPDVVFFAKDTGGRYAAVNSTLVRRLGCSHAREVLGRTTCALFAPPLGDRYLAQDLAVIRSGRPIEDLLELHLYPDHHEGWCVTTKLPLLAADGEVVGLVGTSRDARLPAGEGGSLADLAEAVRMIRANLTEPLRVDRLASLAHLSPYQFTRRVKALFGVTPAQLIIATRVDAARRLLHDGEQSIAAVAQACGYCDQSAFTRQFKSTVGLTPSQYRQRLIS